MQQEAAADGVVAMDACGWTALLAQMRSRLCGWSDCGCALRRIEADSSQR